MPLLLSGQAPRILIVDDSEQLRSLVCDVFKSNGFVVLDANCAETALIMVASQAVDCVLTDLEMPGASGIELCNKLKRMEPVLGQKMPVWVMTGLPGENIENRARAAGAV